jgi:hypothetical protein
VTHGHSPHPHRKTRSLLGVRHSTSCARRTVIIIYGFELNFGHNSRMARWPSTSSNPHYVIQRLIFFLDCPFRCILIGQPAWSSEYTQVFCLHLPVLICHGSHSCHYPFGIFFCGFNGTRSNQPFNQSESSHAYHTNKLKSAPAENSR